MLTAPRDLGTVCEKRSGAYLAFAAYMLFPKTPFSGNKLKH